MQMPAVLQYFVGYDAFMLSHGIDVPQLCGLPWPHFVIYTLTLKHDLYLKTLQLDNQQDSKHYSNACNALRYPLYSSSLCSCNASRYQA